MSLTDARRVRPAVERLEGRDAPAGLQPTAADQYVLEQVNDARANPAAYGAAHGLRLNGIAPRQPLAFDPRLVAVAHRNAAAGIRPLNVNAIKAQIRATGYHFFEAHSIVFGEGSLGGFPGPVDQAALDLLISGLLGKDAAGRVPLLGTPKPFPGSAATPQLYREVGIGVVKNVAGYAIVQPVDNQPRLTGAVFRDANGNGKYDLGEGLAGVTIQVSGAGSVAAFASGGYTMVLRRPGTYQVTATGGGLAAPVTQTVRVPADRNVRLNFAVP